MKKLKTILDVNESTEVKGVLLKALNSVPQKKQDNLNAIMNDLIRNHLSNHLNNDKDIKDFFSAFTDIVLKDIDY